eukprot:gnl/TRDRNA2_/TRDRNA2_84625_c0_seq2.p1 gnl/TRDRNA2_/TRDRNA2_84625_c0~~gnl/TRDRNA2_/TRDRNA2_84625_c0_seq2.p1  ORF type:complete len:679 (+),score=146.08 gnl/TRDRNA2_/TRDRNA2_84625_c0_seq2:35-2071(+)
MAPSHSNTSTEANESRVTRPKPPASARSASKHLPTSTKRFRGALLKHNACIGAFRRAAVDVGTLKAGASAPDEVTKATAAAPSKMNSGHVRAIYSDARELMAAAAKSTDALSCLKDSNHRRWVAARKIVRATRRVLLKESIVNYWLQFVVVKRWSVAETMCKAAAMMEDVERPVYSVVQAWANVQQVQGSDLAVTIDTMVKKLLCGRSCASSATSIDAAFKSTQEALRLLRERMEANRKELDDFDAVFLGQVQNAGSLVAALTQHIDSMRLSLQSAKTDMRGDAEMEDAHVGLLDMLEASICNAPLAAIRREIEEIASLNMAGDPPLNIEALLQAAPVVQQPPVPTTEDPVQDCSELKRVDEEVSAEEVLIPEEIDLLAMDVDTISDSPVVEEDLHAVADHETIAQPTPEPLRDEFVVDMEEEEVLLPPVIDVVEEDEVLLPPVFDLVEEEKKDVPAEPWWPSLPHAAERAAALDAAERAAESDAAEQAAIEADRAAACSPPPAPLARPRPRPSPLEEAAGQKARWDAAKQAAVLADAVGAFRSPGRSSMLPPVKPQPSPTATQRRDSREAEELSGNGPPTAWPASPSTPSAPSKFARHVQAVRQAMHTQRPPAPGTIEAIIEERRRKASWESQESKEKVSLPRLISPPTSPGNSTFSSLSTSPSRYIADSMALPPLG